MQTEVIVAVVVLFVLVGGIMLAVPRVGRRGLLFGVYVGEEGSRGADARRITRGWTLATAAWLVVGLLACLALSSVSPELPVVVAPWVITAGFFATYLVAHLRSRALAVEPARVSAASVGDAARPASLLLPLTTLVLGTAAGLFSVGYAAVHWSEIPQRVPVHFGAGGEPDGWSEKSVLSVFLLPVLNLVMSVGMGVLCVFLARAKRVLRVTRESVSARAQERFRGAMTLYLCATVWAMIGLLTSMCTGAIDTATGAAEGLSSWVPAFGIALGVVTLGALPALLLLGQGGSRLEGASASAPLSEALADDRHWKLGLVYFNREDPSFLVEHRFGLGYTINFANRAAVAFLAGFLLLVVAIAAAATLL